MTLNRTISASFMCLTVALNGCAAPAAGGGILDRTLESIGIARPSEPLRLPQPNRQVTLRLHAGGALNTDATGQSLALVARIYKLRNANAFLQLPYGTFLDARLESQSIGKDIIDMQEIVMTPGKKYEVIETMPPDASHLAVVALFRTPDSRRWRFVFDVHDLERTGITIGMHDCALSLAQGEPVGAPPEVRRLAGMQCPTS